MHAITISQYGGPEVLTLATLPDPVPAADEVLIEVRAFGLNHAETYMRSGKWGEVAKVTGIECAGLVRHDPSGRLAAGAKVVAIMGGLGRTRDGSYAELVTVPAANVIPVSTAMPWTDLVAVPEAYAAAWAGLHLNLAIAPGQRVLIRGATSALGQAAVNIAAGDGAQVIASTRSPSRAGLLRELGAADVAIDDGALTIKPVDAVLDLVGNTTLRDSLRLVGRHGRVCQLGFLGGLDPVDGFNPIADLPSGVQLSFFGSFVLGTPDFPIAEIPIADLIGKAERGEYQAKPVRVFAFDEIVEAHRVMEAGTAGGKMVVSVTDG
jgi:NADPH:quinone reductase-like Zn-dependent oxidoreductase